MPSEGTKLEQIGGGVGNGRAQDGLVAIIRHAHGEQRAALGEDGRVELGRTLRHEAEKHAVFAAFLGDARDGAAGRAEADDCGRRTA